MRKNTEKKSLLRFFIDFYRHIRIPWWLFILNTALGIVTAEISLKLSALLIRVNQGELYNSVILGYAFLYILNSVIAYAENLFYDYGANKVVLRARLMLWKRLLHLPVSEIEARQPSSLIAAETSEVTASSQTIGYLFLMISSLYGFVRACSTLHGYNATLSLWMLGVIPVALLLFWACGKLSRMTARWSQVTMNGMTMFFSEHISAAKYVKAAAMEDKELESGLDAIRRSYRVGLLTSVLSNVQVVMFHLYRCVTVVVTALGGSKLIERGEMPGDGINTFDTYMNRVNQYISELLTHYQTFNSNRGTLGRVCGILDVTTEDPNAGEAWREGEDRDIVFDNVDFGYTPERPVLRGVSVRIPAGKTTAIVGDNGCGKSTLLKLMQGFYKPSSGAVDVAGNRVGEVKLSELRGHFGYVLQTTELFTGSIRDNIAYGVEEISDETVEAAAKAARLDALAASLPEGYDTNLGEGGGQLSGGQRQRIGIARAIVRDPDYLLLDEAGSSLDYHTYSGIRASIRERFADKTVVFIAHDMREILTADYVVVMDHGRVEAAGTHRELMGVSPTYQDYMRRLEGVRGGAAV